MIIVKPAIVVATVAALTAKTARAASLTAALSTASREVTAAPLETTPTLLSEVISAVWTAIITGAVARVRFIGALQADRLLHVHLNIEETRAKAGIPSDSVVRRGRSNSVPGVSAQSSQGIGRVRLLSAGR